MMWYLCCRYCNWPSQSPFLRRSAVAALLPFCSLSSFAHPCILFGEYVPFSQKDSLRIASCRTPAGTLSYLSLSLATARSYCSRIGTQIHPRWKLKTSRPRNGRRRCLKCSGSCTGAPNSTLSSLGRRLGFSARSRGTWYGRCGHIL